MNNMNDEIVVNEFFNCSKTDGINRNKTRISWLNSHKDLYNYILNRYIDSDSIQETLWRIKLGIEIKPKCPVCGSVLRFSLTPYKNGRHYPNYCSNICSIHSDERKKKCENTLLERYGDKNYNNREKNKKTCLERYGVNNPGKSEVIKEKIKNTCKEKYGCEYSFQSDNNKIKSKITKKEKYGDENFNNREKNKKTCLERYGVESPLQSEIIREKHFLTKHKNNTFKTSIREDKLYKKLIELYSDTIRQYKSKLYPFHCDFYIPSLDLYIEYNGMWTHGGHAFNIDNKEDKDYLDIWKEKAKTSKFYEGAINVWTIKDPLKRNTAKENKLNYIEIWDLDIDNLDIRNVIDEYFKNSKNQL